MTINRRGAQANPRTWRLVAAAVTVSAAVVALVWAGAVESPLPSHRGIPTRREPDAAGNGRSQTNAHSSNRLVRVQPQRRLKPGWLLMLKGQAVAAIATAGGYVVWEFQPSDEHPVSALMERNRRTGRTRRLAASVLPQFGLASTTTRIVYARAGAAGSELRAIRHDGGNSVVLSRSLAAPFASRGNVIAWAEEVRAKQRVVLRNMSTGRQWVAAQMPRCNGDRCYRIDAVTLADDGVVFDRGAIGAHPSLIVRRRLRDAKPTIARLKNDPQPDLAPSSAGAFYFWLQHGWMRWDFGRLHPHPTHLNGLRWWVVGYEHGRLLLRTGTKCRPRLVVRVRGKRTQAVTSPNSTPASPTNFGPLCGLMTGFAWQGRRLLVAWAIIPRISLTAANDVGLVGAVTETTTP